MRYKITIAVERNEDSKYPSHDTIYEQTVNGDESIVNGVVKVVLDYNSQQQVQQQVSEQVSGLRQMGQSND